MVNRCRYEPTPRAAEKVVPNSGKRSNYNILVKPAPISEGSGQISTKGFRRRLSQIGQVAKNASDQSFEIAADSPTDAEYILMRQGLL